MHAADKAGLHALKSACGQAVFGLERLVDRTIARRVPKVAYGTSFALRFANNVVGGENFIDMARWAGIQ